MQIRPLEEAYKFGHFFSPLMTESDFEAKPSVLLLGQYSTGKTTFIKFLLGREDGYPGIVTILADILLGCAAIPPSAAADSVQHPCSQRRRADACQLIVRHQHRAGADDRPLCRR